MPNMHTIIDGRLVEDPRFFETKKDKTELCSIRVADNPGKDSKYVTSFVSFVLNERLTEIVKERGLAKGDLVAVGGELREKEYDKKSKGGKKVKKGEKGKSLEIAYVSLFRITKCAADAEQGGDEDEPEETEAEETEETAAEGGETEGFSFDEE